jgi:hypothetical protein
MEGMERKGKFEGEGEKGDLGDLGDLILLSWDSFGITFLKG